MSKSIIKIGYENYVVNTADAVKIADIMAGAERYRDIWRKTEDGGTTHHVWAQEQEMDFTIRPIPDAVYTMYKLAGKPQE